MSGSIDVCEILVFISKTDPLVRQLEEKRVDSGETSNIRTPQRWWSSSSGKSFLDSYDHKLTIIFTDVGSLEQLLGKFFLFWVMKCLRITDLPLVLSQNKINPYAEHEVEGGLEIRGWLEGPRGRWRLKRPCFSGISLYLPGRRLIITVTVTVTVTATINIINNTITRVEGDQDRENRSLTFSVDFGSSYELVIIIILMLPRSQAVLPNVKHL